MTLSKRICALAVSLAALASGAASADPAGPGLPMWVIRDADSTIYMTGTIHMLPPEVTWDSGKLRNAIKDASELWLEIPMGSDVMKFATEAMPIMMKYATAATPLDTLLTADEIATLKARIADVGLPPETFLMLNGMKPWFASVMLGISPLVSGGYDPEAGIDFRIARLAEEDGDAIKGFETVEEQTKILASGTDEEQLAALRHMLAMSKDEVAAMKAQMDDLAVKWATGDITGAQAMFSAMTATDKAQFGGVKMEAILLQRNENWAGQIETMLKGAGTHFIAVGGGHLVGPDSVQERLKLRGIATERY